jgi:hypothetical protein
MSRLIVLADVSERSRVSISLVSARSVALTSTLGSTTVYPYGNKSLAPMELGASIFVAANKNLWRATDVFNLTRIEFEDDSIEDDSVGIWDGETFPFVVSSVGSFLTKKPILTS